MEYMKYKYTQTWFLNSEIRHKILNYVDLSAKNTILEIGCFEGLASTFFADNLLNNPHSSLTCVDPFLNIDNNDHTKFLMNNEEDLFDYNIRNCRNSDKIHVNKVTSDAFFATNTKTYNFIYVDGCHECDFITRDMENAFKVLEINGIMWMDDYLGGDGTKIRDTMNRFLEKYKYQYTLIHSGYQLAIKKQSCMDLTIVPSILNTHDLSVLWPYAKGPQFKYFNWEAGNEHYRLLFHISWQIPNGSTIIDIGTSTGHSALALSANPNIHIITYNIVDEVQAMNSIKQKKNIEIRIKKCLEDMHDLLKAPFILLDVFHDGTFEKQLIEELIKHNYNGIVLCDDIYLNQEMVVFWNWVPLPKMDITEHGHWSGTGAILFGNSTVNILNPVSKPIAPFYNGRQ